MASDRVALALDFSQQPNCPESNLVRTDHLGKNLFSLGKCGRRTTLEQIAPRKILLLREIQSLSAFKRMPFLKSFI
jgi:hypothetical protein